MRKFLEIVRVLLGTISGTLGGILIFLAPKDLIGNVRADYVDVGINPPWWLNEGYEHQIVRTLFEALLLGRSH